MKNNSALCYRWWCVGIDQVANPGLTKKAGDNPLRLFIRRLEAGGVGQGSFHGLRSKGRRASACAAYSGYDYFCEAPIGLARVLSAVVQRTKRQSMAKTIYAKLLTRTQSSRKNTRTIEESLLVVLALDMVGLFRGD
jgi:hypothetical protein